MGDRQGRPSAMNLCPFIGVDLNLWPTVYIAVIVLTPGKVKCISGYLMLTTYTFFDILCCRLETGDDRVIFCNGGVLHRQQCLIAFGANWFEAVSEFGASLRRHSIDISIFACMSALSLITRKYNMERRQFAWRNNNSWFFVFHLLIPELWPCNFYVSFIKHVALIALTTC